MFHLHCVFLRYFHWTRSEFWYQLVQRPSYIDVWLIRILRELCLLFLSARCPQMPMSSELSLYIQTATNCRSSDDQIFVTWEVAQPLSNRSLIARCMGPTWGLPLDDRAMLAPWTLLSGMVQYVNYCPGCSIFIKLHWEVEDSIAIPNMIIIPELRASLAAKWSRLGPEKAFWITKQY